MGKGGDSTDADNKPSVLSDPRFQPFQQDNFNVAEFTSRVLAGSHITAHAQSEQLREGVRSVENELSAEVISKKKELLHNVRRLLDTEHSLQDVVLSVESLQSAVRRIRAEIVGPYEQVKTKTIQLRNLHATVNMLRNVIHRLKLVQKLKAQLAAPAAQIDYAKAARLISDIRALNAEVDLSGIDVLDGDSQFLAEAIKTVKAQAEAALAEGMESLSQAKVGSALQVFFNLEELKPAVEALMARYIHDIERATKNALDARQLSAGTVAAGAGPGGVRGISSPAPGANASAQEKLWSGLKEVAEQMQSAATAVWHLQRVVAKKKDPLTHVCLLDVLVGPDEPLLTQRFWNDLVHVLSDALTAVSKPSKGGFVREALTQGYPRLAALLESMFDRLSTETTMKGVLNAVGPDQLQQLLTATAPFQSAYMGTCLARMSDAVIAAFPGGTRSLPSPADVQKCIGVMHEELKVGSSSPQLAALMASSAAKALLLLAEKAEYMAAGGQEVKVIGATPSTAQLRNIALCSQLQEIHRSLSSLLPRLPATAATALASALDTVQTTAIDIVAPMIKSVMELVEEKLMGMHSAGLGSDTAHTGDDGMMGTSQYVQDCTSVIANFRAEYLSKFVPPPSPSVPSCVGSLVERMAARTLVFCVRHASLLRPLSQAGKLQVAKDLAELQLAVSQHLYPLEALGPPYRLLKAFRALLFQDSSSVASSSILRELPPSIAVHHLFSRLPAAARAPHEQSGLSPAQYSLWLDQHSQEEAVERLRTALDDVPVSVTADRDASEVLSIMRQLCAAVEGLRHAASTARSTFACTHNFQVHAQQLGLVSNTSNSAKMSLMAVPELADSIQLLQDQTMQNT